MSDFHCFPELPAELQKEIWRWCLPQRVSELDKPQNDIVYGFFDEGVPPSPCSLAHTTIMNGRPPLITRVCRDSRSVAFETGNMSASSLTRDRPSDTTWISGYEMENVWQDRVRDSAHLNWDHVYDVERGSLSDESPLRRLAWDAASLSGNVSLMLSFFDASFGLPTPHPLLWTRSPSPVLADLAPLCSQRRDQVEVIRRLHKCLLVIRTTVVHSDIRSAAATGLFGLLGDACVQVVDISEEEKINALFELAISCERKGQVTVTQDFSRESEDLMLQQLRKRLTIMFRSEEIAAKLRPAIMFRLCTMMCNHQQTGIFEYRSRRRELYERIERQIGRGRGRGRG